MTGRPSRRSAGRHGALQPADDDQQALQALQAAEDARQALQALDG